jgi:alkylation response protein AidB-like acyl-CoA dehydrogenase
MGGALVAGAETLPGGGPNVRCMLFRASDTRVLDTWDTSGLRGSGSHDVEVTDVFVPEERTFSLLTDTPRYAGGTSGLPFFGVLAAGVAAVALGIARAAIDALVLLANAKEPQGARRTLAHRERVQFAVAAAEGKLRAARAFLTESLRDAALEASSSGAPSVRGRALVRVAASHAARAAAEAVDLAYDTGGASSVYSKNPLQRHFRDVHVATQHAMVGPIAMTLGGRVLLGLESDTSML